MAKVLKLKDTQERKALKQALRNVGFVECSERGEQTVYMIDQETRSGEFCAIGLGDDQVFTFQEVLTHLGQMTFRYGRLDRETALAYQDLAQRLMAERAALVEAGQIKAAGNE